MKSSIIILAVATCLLISAFVTALSFITLEKENEFLKKRYNEVNKELQEEKQKHYKLKEEFIDFATRCNAVLEYKINHEHK